MKESIKFAGIIIASYLGFCFLYTALLDLFLLPPMLFRFHYAVTLAGITTFCIFFKQSDKIVFKVICTIFVGYFAVYGINHTITENRINVKMKEAFGFNAEKLHATKGAAYRGKMYTYIADTKRYSDIFIPFGQAAKSPDEVKYLVTVKSTGSRLRGRWTSGGKEYTYDYDVRVVDVETGKTMINETFSTGHRDSSLSRENTNTATGLEHFLLEEVVQKKGRITNSILSCIPLLRL
ncbi:MAG: hypothetical protein LBL24_02950 [Bacteroidales bacterium]|jgi:hypothetical protein|nr:hypothetical protein [Bacteroidales bacterium]